MTLLQIMDDAGTTTRLRTFDVPTITTELNAHRVRFERWGLRPLPAGASAETVLAAYRAEVDELIAEGGYRFVDVARVTPDRGDPQWPARAAKVRSTFLPEHRHAEDEVRFFVSGRGCFYLHLGTEVFAVVCEGGDLLSVPADTAHWFDMGAEPDFCAIRLFEEEDGWVGDFTGTGIAELLPTLDELLTPGQLVQA
jgi:1,2-dihydroxy-3-keto-5-methylthiopentene dioxygenase